MNSRVNLNRQRTKKRQLSSETIESLEPRLLLACDLDGEIIQDYAHPQPELNFVGPLATFDGDAFNGDAIQFKPSDPNASVGIGTFVGDASHCVDASALSEIDGYGAIVIGDRHGANLITVGSGDPDDGPVTVRDPLVLSTPGEGGEIHIKSPLIGEDNASMTVFGSGNTTTLSANVTMTSLSYDDSLIIDGAITLQATAGDVKVTGTITGNSDGADDSLTINATGTVTLEDDIGASGLKNLIINAPTIKLGGKDFGTSEAHNFFDLKSGLKIYTGGNSVTIEGAKIKRGVFGEHVAAQGVKFESDVVLSTRKTAANANQNSGDSTGNSGNVTINAAQLNLSSGAKILSHVANTGTAHMAGNITIQLREAVRSLDKIVENVSGSRDITLDMDGAELRADVGNSVTASGAGNVTINAWQDLATGNVKDYFFAQFAKTTVDIKIDSSTIKGKTVTIDARADSEHVFGESGQEMSNTLATLDNISMLAGWSESRATAKIALGNDSSVTTRTNILANDLTISAEAETNAMIRVISRWVGAAVTVAKPIATITADRVNMTVANDLTAKTLADGRVNAYAKSGDHRYVASSGRLDVVVSVAVLEGEAKVLFDSNSVVVVGRDMTINSDYLKSLNSYSTVSSKDSSFGVVASVGYSDTIADTRIKGTVVAGRNIVVRANDEVPIWKLTKTVDLKLFSESGKNDVGSQISFGEGSLDALARQNSVIKAASGNTPFLNWLGGKVKQSGANQNQAQPATGKTDKLSLQGAISVMIQRDKARAAIEGNARVVSLGGGIDVDAIVIDMPEISARASQSSSPRQKTHKHRRLNSGSLALSFGFVTRKAKAWVGGNAVVDAFGAFDINSKVEIPYRIQWLDGVDGGVDMTSVMTFITDKANSNLGIQNGFFTTWSFANADALEIGGAAALNALIFNNSATTTIHNGAKINHSRNITSLGGSGQLIVDAGHHLNDGQEVVYSGDGGNIPGLVKGRKYYVSVSNSTEVRLKETPTGNAVSISGTVPSGTHLLTPSNGAAAVKATVDTETVNFAGQPWPKNVGQGSGGSGALLNTTYFNVAKAEIKSDVELNAASLAVLSETDGRNIAISTTFGILDGSFAFNGVLEGIVMSNTTHSRIDDGAKITTGTAPIILERKFDDVVATGDFVFDLRSVFRPQDVIDGNVLELPYAHGFSNGDRVVYDDGGGTAIGGLTSGSTYYVEVISPKLLKLNSAQNLADATEVTLNPDVAAGSNHRLDRTFDAVNSDVVDTNADSIDLGYAHEFSDGTPLLYLTNSGSEIGGLKNGQIYYAVVEEVRSTSVPPENSANVIGSNNESLSPQTINLTKNQTTVKLSTSRANATSTSPLPIDLTSSGVSGVHRLLPLTLAEEFKFDGSDSTVVDASGNAIDLGVTHGLKSGDPLVYSTSGTAISTGATTLLESGGVYYAVVDATKPTKIQLATSLANATATSPVVVSLSAVGTGSVHAVAPIRMSTNVTFDGSAASIVDTASDSLTLGATHGLSTGDSVFYSKDNAGTAIGFDTTNTLVDGKVYYIAVDPNDSTKVMLADSYENAVAATPTVIDLTGLGTGTNHGLTPIHFVKANSFDGASSSAIDTTENTIDVGANHGWKTGAILLYTTGDLGTGINTGGNTTLTDRGVYYAVVDSTKPSKVRLATTYAGATKLVPDVITLSAVGTGNDHALAQVTSVDATRDFTPLQNLATYFDLPNDHGHKDGDAVIYDKGDGSVIGGLIHGRTYYVDSLSPSRFRL